MAYKPRAVVTVTVTCPKGHETITDQRSLETTDGCYGHDSESYCYCPSPKVVVRWACEACPKHSWKIGNAVQSYAPSYTVELT